MPLEPAEPAISTDPRDWRPQTIYRARHQPNIIDPLLEPLWSGTRVIAHYRDSDSPDRWGDVDVLDSDGQDASSLAPHAVDQLRRAVSAADAVIDGIISSQATGGGEGTAIIVFAQSQPMRRMFVGGVESDIKFAEPKNVRRGGEPGFVALDLLSIDGQSLLDVPLLERKRLLEGAIEQSELVRVSPWARPPVRTWFSSWRSAGFRGLIMKSANSRYVPGEETTEWAIVDRMPRR
jgi:ATP-dependent DNA ligase